MSKASNLEKQIIHTHADFIVLAATAKQERALITQLEERLAEMEDSGWHALVEATRKYMNDGRDFEVLNGLDAEDRIIMKAVLEGAADPSTLPDPDAMPEPAVAAPGLAQMVFDATVGDAEALESIAAISASLEQLGENSIGERLVKIVEGERDRQALTANLDRYNTELMSLLLDELGRLEAA